MTANRGFKQRVRARMAVTGENYTTARRALEADGRPARSAPPASDGGALRRQALEAMRPGTLTVVSSPSALANFTLSVPVLAGLLTSGGALMHTVDGPAGLHGLPNHVDFGLAAGVVDRRKLLAGTTVEREGLARQMRPLRRHLLSLSGRVTVEEVERWAHAHAAAGRQCAVWVQDVRAGGLLDLGRRQERFEEELAAQLPVLRRLAAEHGLVVGVGLVGGSAQAEVLQQLVGGFDWLFTGLPRSTGTATTPPGS